MLAHLGVPRADLWYAIFAYFIIMWFLFWFFEHGINPKIADIYWEASWCEIPWYRVPKRASGIFFASGKRHNKELAEAKSADSRTGNTEDPEVGHGKSGSRADNVDDDEITLGQGWLGSM